MLLLRPFILLCACVNVNVCVCVLCVVNVISAVCVCAFVADLLVGSLWNQNDLFVLRIDKHRVSVATPDHMTRPSRTESCDQVLVCLDPETSCCCQVQLPLVFCVHPGLAPPTRHCRDLAPPTPPLLRHGRCPPSFPLSAERDHLSESRTLIRVQSYQDQG